MHFYWVKCRIAQGQFKLLWRSGRENLADYFTKLHAKVHHKITQPLYVINSLASRGCNKGVFIGINITYVPFVLTTSNSNRLEHIGMQTPIAQPSARNRPQPQQESTRTHRHARSNHAAERAHTKSGLTPLQSGLIISK